MRNGALADLRAVQSVNEPEDVTVRILFIGPRTSDALSLCATLENSSPERFRVLEVEGTDEGIALLHKEGFHLLVLDDGLLMPTRRKSLEVLRQAAPQHTDHSSHDLSILPSRGRRGSSGCRSRVAER